MASGRLPDSLLASSSAWWRPRTESGGSSCPWMRCSWFQVDSPCLMSRSRAGGGLAGTGRSGGSGRAILISISIL